jgi:hypothetical protein
MPAPGFDAWLTTPPDHFDRGDGCPDCGADDLSAISCDCEQAFYEANPITNEEPGGVAAVEGHSGGPLSRRDLDELLA